MGGEDGKQNTVVDYLYLITGIKGVVPQIRCLKEGK